MAIEDIISLAKSGDTKASDFLKSASQYQSNRELLRALGEKDTQGKAGTGVLSSIFKVIGTPGRLIRTPIIEALGGTPELRTTSGADQFMKVLRGEISPGFGDIPALRTKSKDSIITKLPKLGAALVGDIATDPISYIGGAGFLGRKQAAEILALKGEDIYDKLGTVGLANVDKIVAETPFSKFAKLQKEVAEERGITLKPEDIKTTPAGLMDDPVVAKRFKSEAVGNYLAEGLLVSRKELLNRLEKLTGSKTEALALFKTLPEGVRGGLVVTGLLGKPIQKEDGSYIRLTSGTGEKLGKFGEVVNRYRLTTANKLAPITKATNEGEAGLIYANVRNRLANKVYKDPLDKLNDQADASKYGEDRFIDYVKIRKSMDKEREIKSVLNSKIESVYANYRHTTDPYINNPDKKIAEQFATAFKDAFFRPMNYATKEQIASTFGDNPATIELILAAKSAADNLRKEINALSAEAKARGVVLSKKGAPEEWTPLVYLEDIIKEKRALEGAASDYSTTFGRTVGVMPKEFSDKKDLFGYKDLQNPDLIWMDAPSMNKYYREFQKQNGEIERDLFEEDPIKMYLYYATDLVNRIASARFNETLRGLGVQIKDIPEKKKVLDDVAKASFINLYQKQKPDILKAANDIIDNIKTKINNDTNVLELKGMNERIAELRVGYKNQYDSAVEKHNNLLKSLKEYDTVLDSLPNQNALLKTIKDLRFKFLENAEELEAAQIVARNLKEEIRKVNKDLDNINAVLDQFQITLNLSGKEKYTKIINSVIDLLKKDYDAGIDRLNQLDDGLELAVADLENVRQIESGLTGGFAQNIINTFTVYKNTLELKIKTLEDIKQVRKERKTAALNWRYAENNVYLEKLDNINGYVTAYNETLNQKLLLKKALDDRKAEIKKELRVEGITDVTKIKAEVSRRSIKEQQSYDAAVKVTAEQKKLLKNIIIPEGVDKAYTNVMGPYFNQLIKLSENLSKEQFQSAIILSNDKKIEEYIAKILDNSRDSKVALDAMGDMYKAYESISNALNVGQKDELLDLLNIQDKSKVVMKARPKKSTLIKEELQASEAARRFQQLYTKDNYDELTESEYKLLDVNKATSRVYSNSSVRHLMNVLYRKTKQPDEFEKWVDQYFDPLQQLWKTSVTVTRGPAYWMINLMGGAVMNYLGDVSMQNIKLASKALYKIQTTLSKLEKKYPEKPYTQNLLDAEQENIDYLKTIAVGDTTLDKIVNKFFDMGGFYNTETKYTLNQIMQSGDALTSDKIFRYTGAVQMIWPEPPKSKSEEFFRKLINFGITNKYQRLVNNQAQVSELFNRLSAFIDGYEKYGNYEAAMSNVYLLHFNYQDLSPAEEWLRRLMPFYTWTRNNIPAQFRAIMLQPGKIQRLLYANEEFQNTFGAEDDYSWLNQVLPEYVNIADGFATQFKYGDNNIGFYLRLPHQDINRMFQIKGGLPQLRGREAANLLGPFTLPLELASGVDLSTGAPFNPAGTVVPDYYKALDIIPGIQTYRDIEGQTRINQGVVKTLQELLPVLPFAERAVSGATAPLQGLGVNIPEAIVSKTQQEKALADLLNVTGISSALGGSVVTLTPTALSGELRGRMERQTANIRRLAASGNYDTDWIREQLRNGVSPEQIAILIQSGYGALKTDEQTISNKTLNRYREDLSKL